MKALLLATALGLAAFTGSLGLPHLDAPLSTSGLAEDLTSLAGPVLAGPTDLSGMGPLSPGTVVGETIPNAVHYMRAPVPHGEVSEELQKAAAPVVGSTFGIGLPLQYGGGPVLVHNQAYVVYWGPTSAFSATYKSLTQRYFNDVAGSDIFHTTEQYYQDVGAGQENIASDTSLGGVWSDTSSYPSSDVTEAEIAAEAAHAIAVNGWSATTGHIVFVYTAIGAISEGNGYCAYHGFYNAGSQIVAYAVMVHPNNASGFCLAPTAPSGDTEADAVVSVTSHEHWEAVTDPDIGGGWTAADLDEGSDQCNFIFGSTDGAGADTYMNGHPYILQEQWSNEVNPVLGCTMGP
jgi:hypothetical protein